MRFFSPWAPLAQWARRRLQTGLPSVVVLLLGISVTLAVWHVARTEAHRLDRAKFEAHAQEAQSAIDARMVAYEQILRGGVSLFATLGEVSRAQWSTYVTHLQVHNRFPGIHGVGYAAYLPLAAKDDFVRRAQAQGTPSYDIRPTGNRDHYAPVTYLEPATERNLKALGFDMLSEPVRREAMARARDSGEPAVTGKLRLASEPNNSGKFGFLLYAPVYFQGMPTNTVAQRARALRGFVNSPCRIDDLLHGVLGSNTEKINLKIYDGDVVSAAGLMFDDHDVDVDVDIDAATQLFDTRVMTIHGHPWTLTFSSPVARQAGDNNALLLLLSGFVVSVLLSALAYSVTARMQLVLHSEQHYFRLANFDSLTGLPNRSMFHDRLQRSLIQTQRDGKFLALLFFDVDNFKGVNDSLGHLAGDLLLKEIASRTQACVRRADTVARLGGDEFTVVLCDLHGPEDAGNVAQNLLNAMAQPCLLLGKPCALSISIGISVYPGDATDAAALLKNADQAMYLSKRRGHGQFQYAATA